MQNLDADKMISFKVWTLSILCFYFQGLGMLLEPFAIHALHFMHWVFRTTQWGANGATIGTFLLALFKTYWPNVSIRERIINIFKRFKKKNNDKGRNYKKT